MNECSNSAIHEPLAGTLHLIVWECNSFIYNEHVHIDIVLNLVGEHVVKMLNSVQRSELFMQAILCETSLIDLAAFSFVDASK